MALKKSPTPLQLARLLRGAAVTVALSVLGMALAVVAGLGIVLLRLYGHEVEGALGGPAALRAAQAQQPDAVLLDISMPGMSGYQVARQLRAMEATSGGRIERRSSLPNERASSCAASLA